MTDYSHDLSQALFAKTTLGQQEIQARTQGLGLLARRLLILVDGKRSFQELSAFIPEQNLADLLDELHTKGCIQITNI